MGQRQGLRGVFSIATAMVGLILFAGIVTGGDAIGFGSCDVELQVELNRSTSALDSDAEGTISVYGSTKKGAHSFEVFAENIDGQASLELWIEYPLLPGTFLFIAQMESNGDQSARYTLENEGGVALPHGAASISDLAGLGVDLRRGSASILYGTIPTLK